MLKSNVSKTSKNILILMSGSIACYKVCTVVSQLKQKNYLVKIVMSEAAQKFIGPATIEGLSGESPITDMYAKGSVMDHIYLARWADLILVAPATANTINKMAAGLGDDLITTLFLAHDFQKPFLLTPAMNTKMYQHPTTQKSLSELKMMGVQILETASGVLACGEVGYGRLLEPELIIGEIESRMILDQKISSAEKNIGTNINSRPRQKILITSGGTQEAIDDVRVITNKSTGRTAAKICDQLIESGFAVTYLHAENAKSPMLDCQKVSYSSFQDIDTQLTNLLTTVQFDFVIHAAAISDYSVVKSADGKIDSSANELTIHLKKNPKLIQKIKKLSPNSKLIGFKLTSTTDENVIQNKIHGLFKSADCDYVIQNDWSTVKTGNSVFNLYSKNRKIEFLTLDNLTIEIAQIILNQESI
jgi:phosphopantothenoylcysteine decarboxylase / phosphopantothenate---cysteine ligase